MSNEHVRITLRLTIPELSMLVSLVDVGQRTLQDRFQNDPEALFKQVRNPEEYTTALRLLTKKLDKARKDLIKAVAQ